MGSTEDDAKLAKTKSRNTSEKGGLLNRMFGSSSSPSKNEDIVEEPRSSGDGIRPSGAAMGEANDQKGNSGSASPVGRSSEDGGVTSPTQDAKRSRRSSGIAKAKEMFGSAKSALSASPTRTRAEMQTPMQKLGKIDPALSVPQGSLNNAAGESVPGPRSTFRVGVTEDKNKKCRRTMEDTHAYLYNFLSTPAPVLDPKHRSELSQVPSNSSVASGQPVVESDNGYFAIFDGHAGTFAAEWCGKKLHLLLEDTIRKNPNKAIPELLDETFTSVDQQLEKLPLKNSGCTAVTAVLRWEDRIPNTQSATGSTSIAPAAASQVDAPGSEPAPAVEAKVREAASRQRVLYTANVGDARIVLCRNGKALRLSYDHKGSDDNEGKRIANAGGLILNNRVNGVLAVTRALGDAYMKDLVTGHPYTTETVIQPDIDEFLILACDGLWDVCTDQEAVDLIRSIHDPQPASKALVDHALARFSTDNLSCMVIRFNTSAVADAIAARTEPIGVEGDPSTKIRGGVSESAAIVGAAKRSLGLEGEGEGGSGRGSNELGKLNTQTIVEAEERAGDEEPGPELDLKGLEMAREKAQAGKEQVGMQQSPPQVQPVQPRMQQPVQQQMQVGSPSAQGEVVDGPAPPR